MDITCVRLIGWIYYTINACMRQLKEIWWDMQWVRCFVMKYQNGAEQFCRVCASVRRKNRHAFEEPSDYCLSRTYSFVELLLQISTLGDGKQRPVFSFLPVYRSKKRRKRWRVWVWLKCLWYANSLEPVLFRQRIEWNGVLGVLAVRALCECYIKWCIKHCNQLWDVEVQPWLWRQRALENGIAIQKTFHNSVTFQSRRKYFVWSTERQ